MDIDKEIQKEQIKEQVKKEQQEIKKRLDKQLEHNKKDLNKRIIDNKDIVKQIKRELEEKLKDIDYAIDYNTGEVKQNNHFASILHNIYPMTNKEKTLAKEIYKNFYDLYLQTIQDFKKDIQIYKTKKFKSLKTLKDSILEFNILFDDSYYNGFNIRVKDLLNETTRNDYIIQRARIYTQIQQEKLINIGLNEFLECNINDLVNSLSDTMILNASDLTIVQQKIAKIYDKEDINKNNANLYNIIYDIILDLITNQVQQEIKDNKRFYDIVHKNYQEINKDIKEIIERFNTLAIEFNNKTETIEIQQPIVKKLPLLVPTIFNKTYIDKQYATIYNTQQLTLKVMLELDIKASDFRENIVFIDNLTNKKIDLLPIDYAIFIACTELNATNKSLSGISGNIPITIDSIIQYIADNDKLYNTKKRQKSLYDYIIDRLLLYKSCLVDAIYTKDNITSKLYNDPLPILSNTHFNDPFNKNVDSYIIGASAILTIIAKIEDIEGKQYLATYTKAKEYINDSQNNTIENLNIKYYILPKILQQINAKSKGEVYNPKISLNDMYKSLALLKGKDSLTRQEQKRARDTALKFLKHLKTKNILQMYDTKPLPKDTGTDKQPIIKANQKIDYLYIKPNYKAKIF